MKRPEIRSVAIVKIGLGAQRSKRAAFVWRENNGLFRVDFRVERCLGERTVIRKDSVDEIVASFLPRLQMRQS